MPNCVALIPARAGSERIIDKNITELANAPLIGYTITAARESGVFDKVLVSSDSPHILDVAAGYGADVIKRPDEYATATSPDIDWVRHAIEKLEQQGDTYDCFSILRPTSPFRTPHTIRTAWQQWTSQGQFAPYSSLRAVERVKQHPGKMWQKRGEELVPLLPQPAHPFHDSQMKALPEIYVQNASLEIAWTQTAKSGSISGTRIMAFETHGYEGFDINNPEDLIVAKWLIDNSEVELPNTGLAALEKI